MPATLHRAALLLLPLLLLACTRQDHKKLPVDLPGVHPRIVEALAAKSDSLVGAVCYEFGVHRVLFAARDLYLTVDFSSEEAYRRSFNQVDPYIDLIVRVVANEFHGDYYLFTHSARRSRRYDDQMTIRDSREACQRIYQDRTTPPDRKQAMYLAVLDQLEGLGGGLGVRAEAYNGLANCRDEMGDVEGELEYRKRALDVLRKAGMGRATIKQMAIVGYVHGKLDHPDSVLHYAMMARVDAYKLRHPNVVLFVLFKLLRPHYIELGNLALADALTKETQRVLREFKGTAEELDLVMQLMSQYAAWGAWGMFEDCMVRSEALLTLVSEELADHIRVIREGDLKEFSAQQQMASGDLENGNQIFQELEESVKTRPNREHYSRLLLRWGQALLRGGEASRALPVLERGLRYAQEVRLPSHIVKLSSAYASALYQTENYDGVERILEVFRSEAAEDSWRDEYMNYDTLRIRVALALGDHEEARKRVTEALTRLHRTLSGIDATVQAYLFLDGCQELRETIHAFLGDDPRLGYGFEMYWRSLSRRLGEGTPGGESDSGSVESIALAVSDRLTRKIEARDAIHCVYMVGESEVVRWVASRNGIHRDIVSVDRRQLELKLQAVGAQLASDQKGSDASPDLLRSLSTLAAQLTPPDLYLAQSGSEPRLLLISGDRYLDGFPFETLNLAEDGDYRPLLEAWDVAYLRYDGELLRASPEASGLILADPAISPELRRRYPSLAPLPHTVAEAEELQNLTGARLLMNSVATKQALTSLWEDAGFFVISAHFVRDPETPYLTFLPLARDAENTDPDAVYLDLTDVRRADLSGCALVVLSGCASGAPYADTAVWGPGLGDAFLDAGAGSVIQTFWQVRDLQSRRLVTQWAHAWATGKSPVEALCAVRRKVYAESGLTLPFSWAAYAIELGGL